MSCEGDSSPVIMRETWVKANEDADKDQYCSPKGRPRGMALVMHRHGHFIGGVGVSEKT